MAEIRNRMRYPDHYYQKRYYNDDLEKMKKKKKKISRFRNYCRSLCQQSLITGFPVIASTRSVTRKLVKTIVFIICTAGFLYQTSDFLRMFMAYPTMVDVQLENPDTVELPAVTICNKNMLRRKEFCRVLPEECEWGFKNRTEFCSIFPKFCISYESDEDIVFARPIQWRITNFVPDLEFLKKVGQRQSDLIKYCKVKLNGSEPCKNYVFVQPTDSLGKPNNCYAFESFWGQPDAEVHKVPITAGYSLWLDLHPEDYLIYDDFGQAYVYAHDAFAVGNPMKEGLTVEGGKMYNLYVTQIVRIRLPPPYETNCTDYRSMWRKNGGYGPLTKKACSEICRIKAMLNTVGCVATSISYPHNYSSCSINYYAPEEMIEKCSKECNEACEERSYNLRVEVKGDMPKCNLDEFAGCKTKAVILNFIFNRMEVTKFEHEPKYESVEMFSYIGGYMGMWLGISLVALFDFIETIGYLLYYPFKQYTSKRKKISQADFIQRSLYFDRYDRYDI